MAGMLLAVGHDTCHARDLASLAEIVGAIAIGGVVGFVIARRIAMTAMPQLVAAFHSLVGLAAVLVAAAAFLNPQASALQGADGLILPVSRVEMGLGIAIGAITFSGSVIAFLKLNGNMSGAPIMLPARHVINLGTLIAAILGLIGYFLTDQSPWVFWTITALSLPDRLPADHPDRRRGHAGGRLDAQQLFGLGRGRDGLHAAQHRDDHHRRAGGLVGRDPQLHHVQGDEPQLHRRDRRRLRRRAGRCGGEAEDSARGSAARPRTRPSC
jgi:hypothetical protein